MRDNPVRVVDSSQQMRRGRASSWKETEGIGFLRGIGKRTRKASHRQACVQDATPATAILHYH